MSNPFIKNDKYIIAATGGIFLFSIFTLYHDWAWVAYGLVGFVDLYFIYVIFYAARKSDVHRNEDWGWGRIVPHRFAGVIVFVFLYLTAVFALAEVFFDQDAPDYTSWDCALFKSWIAITSFEYDDYSGASWTLQKYQMWQAFNGILLLTATFGFLISRISSFKERKTLEDFHTLLEWIKPPQGEDGKTKIPIEELKEKDDKIRELKETVTRLEQELEAKK